MSDTYRATYTEIETGSIARDILARITTSSKTKATVIGLSGELGAGKTTLVQSLAVALGVAERLVSPTFVIAKFYETKHDTFKQLIHIDAYRIESVDELVPLGFENILASPHTLVLIEWPERIATAISSGAHFFQLDHEDNKRTIYEKNS